ncbi:MAG: hypothetical protein RIE77_13230 [Phycisphaerales bacterium]|jgi:hypothetical protein
MRIGRCLLAMLGMVFVFGLVPQAAAGVRVASPDARMVIPTQILPDSLESGQWSLLVWIYAEQGVTETSSVLSIGGRLTVVARPDGLDATLAHDAYAATVRLDTPLQSGRWHLLAVSMEHQARRARAWLAIDQGSASETDIASATARLRRDAGASRFAADRQQTGDPVLGPRAGLQSLALSHAKTPGPRAMLLPDVSGLTIGSSPLGLPAAMLTYDALAIRDHALKDVDVGAIWQSRDYYAPHGLDTGDAGGWMNGWLGCSFLAFHAVSPGANGPGTIDDKASWVGGPVRTSNVIILDRARERTAGLSHAFLRVVPIEQAHGFVHASRLEQGMDGFFAPELVSFEAPTGAIGPLGDKARMLATQPTGLIRVMVSANSRGVRGRLAPQPWPEGFAHGFVQALLPRVAGVMMRPATLLDARGGWFGLDTSESTPDVTLVRPLHTRADQWADWTRFGSGTLPAGSRGPGPATSISPGGVYRLRCGPVAGSLLRADAPLVVRSTVLAFPGASTLRWSPERGVMQHGTGEPTGPDVDLPLDTTRTSITLVDGDTFVDDTRLVLDRIVDVRVADAIVVASGSARGAVSVVTDVEIAGGTTVVTLSHPFGERPESDSELRIGPWRFVSVDHRFDPVPAGDDRAWRGQVLRAADDDELGVMLYATSAWRPDVDGFVFGSAGQSGQGYTPQLDSSFPGSLAAWAVASEADVWIQGLAQQRSQPSVMLRYLDELRAGLGADAEVVWAGDAVHAHEDHETWHRFLHENAEDAGVSAVFAAGHPRTGTYFEQAASGMRTDDAHYSSYGSRVIAEVWLDQLRDLTGGPCDVADYNQDAVVDVFDLLVFQSDWEAGDPRADLDGDGQFLIFDFLVLLTAIDQCQ